MENFISVQRPCSVFYTLFSTMTQVSFQGRITRYALKETAINYVVLVVNELTFSPHYLHKEKNELKQKHICLHHQGFVAILHLHIQGSLGSVLMLFHH